MSPLVNVTGIPSEDLDVVRTVFPDAVAAETPAHCPPDADRCAILLASPTAETLAIALRPPARLCAEVGIPIDPQHLAQLGVVHGHGLVLALHTKTAYELNVAGLLCDALEEREAIPKAERGKIELVIHELIANAILHGNLGVASAPKDAGLDGLDEFLDRVDQRLSDDEAARRWVIVRCAWTPGRLSVAIIDQGGGFDVKAIDLMPESERAWGRGIEMAREMASLLRFMRGGRIAKVRFDRPDQAE